MLTIVVPGDEFFDESTQTFITEKDVTLQLEHSLISVSKWEAKWKKPFLNVYDKSDEKTDEELLDYVRCMCLNKSVDESVFSRLTVDNINSIVDYINDPMTATTIRETKGKAQRRIITSEVIYYWMIAQNVPFECQKWHINRLIMLLRVCSAENNPNKNKIGKNELMSRNRALNEARKKKYGTKG